MSSGTDLLFLDFLENWNQGVAIRQGEAYVYVNQAFADLCGYESPEDVIALGPSLMLLPESERERVAQYQAARDQGVGAPVCYELKAVRQDGSLWWAENRVQEILWNGEYAVMSSVIDITERKRVEDELRGSEERYRDLVEGSIQGIAVFVENKPVFANPAMAHILGYDAPGDFLQIESGDDFLHRDEIDRLIEFRRARLQGGEAPDVYEVRAIRRDGSLAWLESRAKVVEWSGKIAIQTTYVDITERKRAESALRESEARLKLSLESGRIGTFVWNIQEGTRFWDDRMHEIWALEPGSFQGPTDTDFRPVIHPDDLARVNRAIELTLDEDAKYNIEYRINLPNKVLRHVQAQATLVRDGQGRPLQMIGVCLDITERKLAAERLGQAQKMEALGQLTAGVAHDFNNMLAVVMGNAELLKDELGEDNPMLAALIFGTQRGADLTQRLLAFSRKQMLTPAIINANSLVADITGLLRRALAENIDIETVTATALWNCEVDPAQLENALVNLAINARDAMPDGGKLTIEIANIRLDDDYAAAQADVKPGQYVMLAVTDSGSGMPPEIRERVFEPFFTTKDVGKGSGLGLSMVYGFVKQSGGHVTIFSEQGEGTTVKLYLPRTTKPATVERNSISDLMPVARGETVFVVEDDPDVRTLAVALLSSLGYRIKEAATGAAALRQLSSSTRVNLLLTDVVLPGGMNGRELAAEVELCAPGIKVLYMSGYTEDAIVHYGRLDADSDLLQKPFCKADLARAVRKVLDG